MSFSRTCPRLFVALVCLLVRFVAAWNVPIPPAGKVGVHAIKTRSALWTYYAPPLQQYTLDCKQNKHWKKINDKRSFHVTQLYQAATENEEEGEVDANDSKKDLWGRVKGYFLQNKNDGGLTFKQRLAKMGVATVLSYGMISNLSYAILISLAWYGFSVQTGTTPLAPGQWKPFLAVYAGFWMFNNIIRPLRLGLSIAVAPSLDKLVLFFQNRLKVSKPLAITVTVIFVNVIGTTLLMGGGIALASLLAGVPVFPPR